MRDYFRKLEEKSRKYSHKYAGRPRKAALKLAFWNLACSFRRHPTLKKSVSESFPAMRPAKKIIAVNIMGGIGDLLIGCNYVYCLSRKFPELSIHVHSRKEIVERFLSEDIWNGTIIDCSQKLREEDYDAVFDLSRYPKVISLDAQAVFQLGDFAEYIEGLQAFRVRYPHFLASRTTFDGMTAVYSSILGKKRIQQADVGDMLGIEEEFAYQLPYAKTDICEASGLVPGRFITVHRGCDTTHTANSIKLWPLEHYDALIEGLKERFPDIPVVQLGINEERCPAMKGVDLNLVGRTSLDDVLMLLEKSRLHIDSEGGYVHMRHALRGGTSIVLFGPTLKEFFGYSENINLRSSVCPQSCEHIMEKWDTYCHLSRSEVPACMNGLLPEDVLAAVIEELGRA